MSGGMRVEPHPLPIVLRARAEMHREMNKQFRTMTCWRCQEDKPRSKGKQTLVRQASGAINLNKFICGECVEKIQQRKKEKAQ